MAHKTFLTVWAACALCGASANAAPIYNNFVTTNGPGDNAGGTTVNGVSYTGAIVGFSSNANMTVLTNFVENPNGIFNPLNINGDPLAIANGINANGVIVGTTGGQAFSSSGGLITLLPAALPGNTASETAFGVNDHSTVVGQFTDNATDTVPGFVYQNGLFTILNPVANAAVTNAQGINNSGLVTKRDSAAGSINTAFSLTPRQTRFQLPPDPVQPNLF